jgi:hypothetical protein
VFAGGSGGAIRRRRSIYRQVFLHVFLSMHGSLGCGEVKKVNFLPKKYSTEVA